MQEINKPGTCPNLEVLPTMFHFKIMDHKFVSGMLWCALCESVGLFEMQLFVSQVCLNFLCALIFVFHQARTAKANDMISLQEVLIWGLGRWDCQTSSSRNWLNKQTFVSHLQYTWINPIRPWVARYLKWVVLLTPLKCSYEPPPPTHRNRMIPKRLGTAWFVLKHCLYPCSR